MKRLLIVVVIVVAVVTGIASQAASEPAALSSQAASRATPSPAAVALKQDMRKLWTDHVLDARLHHRGCRRSA